MWLQIIIPLVSSSSSAKLEEEYYLQGPLQQSVGLMPVTRHAERHCVRGPTYSLRECGLWLPLLTPASRPGKELGNLSSKSNEDGFKFSTENPLTVYLTSILSWPYRRAKRTLCKITVLKSLFAERQINVGDVSGERPNCKWE